MTAMRRLLGPDAKLAALLGAGALAFRLILPFPRVVAGGWIRFQDEDPWYHMRLVENLVHHFPRPLTDDPYLAHPGGQAVPVAPLFDEILAGAAWIAGGGSPSSRLIEWVGALAPPVFAAAAVATVYFCALTLWGRIAAVLAGAIAAFLPGQFLERSVLGFTDHHVAEVLWSGLALLFFLKAAGPGSEALRKRSSILAGVFLAAYLLTWPSGVVVVVLLGIWSMLQSAGELWRVDPAPPVADAAALALAATLALLLPVSFFAPQVRQAAILVTVAAAVFAAFGLVTRLVRRHPLARLLLPAGAAAIAAVTVLAIWRLFPAVWQLLGSDLRRLLPTPERETVAEAVPFLQSGPGATPFWREFSSAGPVAAVGFFLAARKAWRGNTRELLIIVWCSGFLALTLAQGRFAYYLVVPAALLAASVAAAFIPARPARPAWAAAAVLGALLVLVGPGLRLSVPEAQASSGPSDSWREALLWLKAHSPDPFSRKDYYDALYPDPDAGQASEHSSYGVLAWWDYGYWILGIANRVPVANPTQHGAGQAARAFLEEDERAALTTIEKMGVAYVVVDRELLLYEVPSLPGPIGKFPALAVWAREPAEKYFEKCLYLADGRQRRITLFYPDYFETLVVRLALFGGAGSSPAQSWVVTFRADPPQRGELRRIEEFRRFPSSEEAVLFAAADPLHRRVASLSPTETCVPVAPSRSFRLVHSSPGPRLRLGEREVAPVSIYSAGPSQAVAPPD